MNTKAISFIIHQQTSASIICHRQFNCGKYLFGLFIIISFLSQKHPQREDYWGHVNPIGPRACYDEGKRVAETMCYAYAKQVPKRTQRTSHRQVPNRTQNTTRARLTALQGFLCVTLRTFGLKKFIRVQLVSFMVIFYIFMKMSIKSLLFALC